MIVRNINQAEVRKGLYSAHGGGTAVMLFDGGELQGLLFLAQGILRPGKQIEIHADPHEEVYYLLQGEGLMTVGADLRRVRQGDAVWIPCRSVHGLENDGEIDCAVLVVAAPPRRRFRPDSLYRCRARGDLSAEGIVNS